MKAKFGVKLNKKDNTVTISQNGNIISTWTYDEFKNGKDGGVTFEKKNYSHYWSQVNKKFKQNIQ